VNVQEVHGYMRAIQQCSTDLYRTTVTSSYCVSYRRLAIKIVQLSIVYNYRTLRHAMTKKWRHFRNAAFAFSGWIGLLKLERVKTMGTRGKIDAIWWNIKINLRKLVDICGYELPTNLQKCTQKNLTEEKIFLEVLGGLLFWNTL